MNEYNFERMEKIEQELDAKRKFVKNEISKMKKAGKWTNQTENYNNSFFQTEITKLKLETEKKLNTLKKSMNKLFLNMNQTKNKIANI